MEFCRHGSGKERQGPGRDPGRQLSNLCRVPSQIQAMFGGPEIGTPRTGWQAPMHTHCVCASVDPYTRLCGVYMHICVRACVHGCAHVHARARACAPVQVYVCMHALAPAVQIALRAAYSLESFALLWWSSRLRRATPRRCGSLLGRSRPLSLDGR